MVLRNVPVMQNASNILPNNSIVALTLYTKSVLYCENDEPMEYPEASVSRSKKPASARGKNKQASPICDLTLLIQKITVELNRKPCCF